MSLLADRFTAPAEPEEPTVTTPRPRSYGVPWWAGVPGLDPAIPVGEYEAHDYVTAASYTALACAVHMYGLDAAYRTAVLPFGKKAVPANLRLRAWLLDRSVTTPEHAARRRFGLRLACEHGAGLEVDGLLQVAQDFTDALGPG